MKQRRREYGDCNMIGKHVESLRKARGIKQKDMILQMQLMGCDINPTSYSKLEGQVRLATDREAYIIAKILRVTVDSLYE